MNWTGGQLRRHSARPGVLSKTQRQNFAKSRQLTSSRASAQPTPFRRFPDGCLRDGTGELAEANQATGPGKPRSAKVLPNDRLGVLKRRLLQQPDWAAVSVARPLEIEFPSMEEVGQVARRRKLTDVDRKRLSAHGDLTLPEFYKRRLPSSESFGLGQVKIRIDGRLAGSPSPSDDTQALPTNNPSSYSMLLDSEPPALFQADNPGSSPVFSWKLSSGRLSLQPSHNRAPPRLEEPDIPINTHMVEHSDPADYTPLRDVASKFNLANSSPYCS
ncbi:uncharacterized protein N7503_006806, partial [Penicillium pulvis]|uniref:uncharacterized protein n=1 Tax=Penicillium pulvis TaxID=1562058 RepID=UPI002547344D